LSFFEKKLQNRLIFFEFNENLIKKTDKISVFMRKSMQHSGLNHYEQPHHIRRNPVCLHQSGSQVGWAKAQRCPPLYAIQEARIRDCNKIATQEKEGC